MTDYTVDERVLEACGIAVCRVPPAALGLPVECGEQIIYELDAYEYFGDVCPALTLSKLWPALCEVWRAEDKKGGLNTRGTLPRLNGVMQVEISGESYEIFSSSKYGSIENAVAAGICFVLKEKDNAIKDFKRLGAVVRPQTRRIENSTEKQVAD